MRRCNEPFGNFCKLSFHLFSNSVAGAPSLSCAIGNVAVAISWSSYFNSLLKGFGINLPDWLVVDYSTAKHNLPDVIAQAPHIGNIPIVFNALAFGIVALTSTKSFGDSKPTCEKLSVSRFWTQPETLCGNKVALSTAYVLK